MTSTNKPTRVVAICELGPTQQQIATAISSQQEFILEDVLITQERMIRDIRALEPDIILIDHNLGGQSTLDIIDDIALQFPMSALIAILPSDDATLIQQVMLAGARGFIVQPFTQINLLSTLRRVRDLEARRQQVFVEPSAGIKETKQPLKVITVYSPRGGAGCSTLAANLALAYHIETGKRVLLLEGKFYFGHLDVLLNIRSQNSITDLIPHAHNIDENLVHDVTTQHVSGIHVLLGPNNIQIAQGIRPDDLYNVLIALQRAYDAIIIDAGSALNENTVTLLDTADRILLVANPEMASLRDASRFIQIGRTLAYTDDKLMIVLNRAGMQGGVKTHDIENALHHQIFTQIPDDPANVTRSLNRGVPLMIQYPRSPASRAIRQMAKQLTEVMLTELVATGVSSPSKAQREALLASSQLG